MRLSSAAEKTEQTRKASWAKSRLATPHGTMAQESVEKPTAMPKPGIALVAQEPLALVVREPRQEHRCLRKANFWNAAP